MAVAAESRERAVLEAVPKQLLIGGRWVNGSTGATFPVEDPATVIQP